MKNKQVKQMICDVISSTKSCGEVWWESTHQRYGMSSYPNSILLVDGMNDIEYVFWYTPFVASLTANQLNNRR